MADSLIDKLIEVGVLDEFVLDDDKKEILELILTVEARIKEAEFAPQKGIELTKLEQIKAEGKAKTAIAEAENKWKSTLIISSAVVIIAWMLIKSHLIH